MQICHCCQFFIHFTNSNQYTLSHYLQEEGQLAAPQGVVDTLVVGSTPLVVQGEGSFLEVDNNLLGLGTVQGVDIVQGLGTVLKEGTVLEGGTVQEGVVAVQTFLHRCQT